MKRGDIELGSGGHVYITNLMFDLSFPFLQSKVVGVSRAPGKIFSFGNITKPFPPVVWFLIIFLLMIMSMLFLAIYKAYHSFAKQLILEEDAKENFFLFPFCKITEPEPLPWFRGGIAGKFSVLLWSVASLLFLFFYVSNLRTVMVTIEYEAPIDTLEDVVQNGKRVWIPKGFISLKYEKKSEVLQNFFKLPIIPQK